MFTAADTATTTLLYPADFKESEEKSKSFYRIPEEKTHFVFRDCKNHPDDLSGFVSGKPTFISSSGIPTSLNPEPFIPLSRPPGWGT